MIMLTRLQKITIFIVKTISLSSTIVANAENLDTITSEDNQKFIDWVEPGSFTTLNEDNIDNLSCGRFIEPNLSIFGSKIDILSSPLNITADSSGNSSENEVLLKGNVQITQGQRLLRADKALLNNESKKVELEGNITFREPGIVLAGERADISLASSEMTMTNAQYVIHDSSLSGTAMRLTRNSSGNLAIENATYTNCRPHSSGWQLVTSEINISDDENTASVKNAKLKINDTTIFYFPYLKLPTSDKRATGILMPSINMSQTNGLDIAQPFYLNLAPNYDIIFTPRFVERRGSGFGAKIRHINKWSRNELVGSIIFNDKRTSESHLADTDYVLANDNRYEVAFSHLGAFSENFLSYIDYTGVSDARYIRDLGNFTLDEISLSNLTQTSQLQYKKNNWLYTISTLDFQSLIDNHENHYSVLPAIAAAGKYKLDNSLNILMSHKLSSFHHSDAKSIEGERLDLDYSVSWTKSNHSGYFRPEFLISHRSYELRNISEINSKQKITTPVFSLKGGFSLEKLVTKTILQTLETDFFYLNSPKKDQHNLHNFDTKERSLSYDLLFENDHFIGGDRISNDERMSIGITSRLIGLDSHDEKVILRVAKSYYPNGMQYSLARQLAQLSTDTNKNTMTAIDLKAKFNENLHVDVLSIKSSLASKRSKKSVTFRYNKDGNKIFNLGYRKSNEFHANGFSQPLSNEIEQLDFSLLLPVSEKINFIGRWYHDLNNNRELEAFAGLEFSSCCWSAAILARRSIDIKYHNDFETIDPKLKNSIILKLELKGIGSTGKKLDRILKQGIFGY